ncbi:hypothetical protein [Amycolatopsis sp. WAC 04197]|uniref:hypothetical protein n=1 Tax=Amycolatopsis sp. WAC 04197 TaxID=2203199 RepID=UPI001F21E23D|nr:hypothetical protein [Amycolatopsis sp. WAC 04197]
MPPLLRKTALIEQAFSLHGPFHCEERTWKSGRAGGVVRTARSGVVRVVRGVLVTASGREAVVWLDGDGASPFNGLNLLRIVAARGEDEHLAPSQDGAFPLVRGGVSFPLPKSRHSSCFRQARLMTMEIVQGKEKEGERQ